MEEKYGLRERQNYLKYDSNFKKRRSRKKYFWNLLTFLFFFVFWPLLANGVWNSLKYYIGFLNPRILFFLNLVLEKIRTIRLIQIN